MSDSTTLSDRIMFKLSWLEDDVARTAEIYAFDSSYDPGYPISDLINRLQTASDSLGSGFEFDSVSTYDSETNSMITSTTELVVYRPDGNGFTIEGLGSMEGESSTLTGIDYAFSELDADGQPTGQTISVTGGVASSDSITAADSSTAGLSYPQSGDTITMTLVDSEGNQTVLTRVLGGSSFSYEFDQLMELNESALNAAGYRLDGFMSIQDALSQDIQVLNLVRDDGKSFTLSLSNNLAGVVQYATGDDQIAGLGIPKYNFNQVEAGVPFTIDDGATDRTGQLKATVQTATVATVLSEGDASTAEVQQLTLTVSEPYDGANYRDVGGSYKFGDSTLSSEITAGAYDSGENGFVRWGAQTVDHWGRLVGDLNKEIYQAVGDQTVAGEPVVTLKDPSSVRTDVGSADETVDLDFLWGSRVAIKGISSSQTAEDTVTLTLSSGIVDNSLTVTAPVLSYSDDNYSYWLDDLAHALNKQLDSDNLYDTYRFAVVAKSNNLSDKELVVVRVDGSEFIMSGIETFTFASDNNYTIDASRTSTTYAPGSADDLNRLSAYIEDPLVANGIYRIEYTLGGVETSTGFVLDGDPSLDEFASAVKAALGAAATDVTHEVSDTGNLLNIIWADGSKPTTGHIQTPKAGATPGELTAQATNGNVDYVITVTQDATSVTGADQVFDFTIDQTAASTPVVADTDGTPDGTLTVPSGLDLSSKITGVTAGDYVYLIKADQTTVLDHLTTDPQTALDNLRGLSDELWSRSKVASDNSVDLTTAGLEDGVYEVVAMDLAGNFSVVADNTLTVTGSNYSSSDAAYDIMFEGIDADEAVGAEFAFSSSSTTAGNAASSDRTAKIVLDIDDASEGDTVEVWADGQEVFSTELTAANISDGQLITDNINFATADAGAMGTGTPNDETVLLEVKIKHGDQYVQDGGDVTWEYQW